MSYSCIGHKARADVIIHIDVVGHIGHIGHNIGHIGHIDVYARADVYKYYRFIRKDVITLGNLILLSGQHNKFAIQIINKWNIAGNTQEE